MKKFGSLITGLLFFLSFVSPAMAAQPDNKWHEAKTIDGNFKAVSSQPDIEVFSAPNIIMIRVNQESEIRVFTILGKLVSQQKLEPGIYQYRLDTHGIYIIKTDQSSSKIAV